jgi:predicted transcriptional regulator of viral defense system
MKILPLLFDYEMVQDRFPDRPSFQRYVASHQSKGDILKLRKGLYGLVDPSTGKLMANPLEIACALSPSAFLSYHAGLAYYGLAEQSFVSCVEVASLSRFRPLLYQGCSYQPVVVTSISGVEDHREEAGVRIANPERLIIDCIDDLPRGGGFSEVAQALGQMRDLSESRLLAYLSERGKAVLYLKVGYFFSRYYGGSISASFLQECQRHRTAKKYYVGTKAGLGDYIKVWSLIVPTDSEETNNALFEELPSKSSPR